jgi:predicted phosphoribosyltransferase
MRFANRRDAGRRLADQLRRLDLDAPVVLGLPRGGVPVAYEVACALDAPLDVLVARKIGAPFQPELGVGAIAEGGVTVFDQATLRSLRLEVSDLDTTVTREQAELQRRVERYRGAAEPPDVTGRTAIVVDDGLATGVTARAALRAVRRGNPARVVLAVPVGPPETATFMRPDADEVVVVESPAHLAAVGQWYDDFAQTTDQEVVELLQLAQQRR